MIKPETPEPPPEVLVGERMVPPWADRDRDLEAKLAGLYRQHLDHWIGLQGDRKFQQKWHVGRAMLDWFYSEHLIDADEFWALNALYSRPSKPGYNIQMYRIVWKASGRASAQVAATSLAPHMGPRPGYQRGSPIAEGADPLLPVSGQQDLTTSRNLLHKAELGVAAYLDGRQGTGDC
ncbi:MAG: hypothetical protein U1F10_07605 [Burkholderiales bacterium]